MGTISTTRVLIRGAGDLATGVAARLWRSGFPVVMTELPAPLLVRRTVSLGEAIRQGEVRVEELLGRRAMPTEVHEILAAGAIPVLVDPAGEAIPRLAPQVVVDARLAKRKLDTRRDLAPLVIALGPGFTAAIDAHAVIETKRGHTLGRVLWQGTPLSDTGIPDPVAGYDVSRVLRAPIAGRLVAHKAIGDRVAEGEPIATILPPTPSNTPPTPILAPFAGMVRGLIAEQTLVPAGLKIGDLDPRDIRDHCFLISDKALAIGGGVLEAILAWMAGRAPIS